MGIWINPQPITFNGAREALFILIYIYLNVAICVNKAYGLQLRTLDWEMLNGNRGALVLVYIAKNNDH